MKTLFIIFLSYSWFTGRTQETTEANVFLNEMRKTVFKEDTLFYTEDLNEITLPEIRKHLLKDTIWIYKSLGSGKYEHADSIILTKDEKVYIQIHLFQQEGKIWPDNLLERSKLTIRDATYKAYRRSANYKEYQPITIYSFSRPIFIRENPICFFYYQYVSGGRGGGQLELYKKDNDKWRFIQWFYFWEGGGH